MKQPNFIAGLPLLLKISGNMCIVMICSSVFDLVNFEINLSFPIKPFYCMTKKIGKKNKCLVKKESLQEKIKNIFYHI